MDKERGASNASTQGNQEKCKLEQGNRHHKNWKICRLIGKFVVHPTILLMKYQQNISIHELQDFYNLSESAVKMRLLRARSKANEVYKYYQSTYDMAV
jgi:hypothetical protein